jgi:hypothetical protein
MLFIIVMSPFYILPTVSKVQISLQHCLLFLFTISSVFVYNS